MLGLHYVYMLCIYTICILSCLSDTGSGSLFLDGRKFIFSPSFIFLLFFSAIPFRQSTSSRLKRDCINRFSPKWFNPRHREPPRLWCLVGTCCNFVGLVPPDRISFGWLASIPFVSIGWKLRLTSNTLDRPTIVPCKLPKRAQGGVSRHNSAATL